jgi:hypothetical protein
MSDRSKSTTVVQQPGMIQVSILWLHFFQKMISTNLRSALPIWQTKELNHMAAGINQGKTDESPRPDAAMVGFSSTPTLRDLPRTTALNFAPIYFRGIKMIAPFSSISTELIFPNLFAENMFTRGLPIIDKIRLMFLNSLLRNLDEKYPDFVRCFGQKNLYELLSHTKQEIKVLITIFGHMISNDFSESDILRDFWSLLMKWLIFSRFTESVVALITIMIQFPNGRDLVISDTGLEALKQLLREITPVPSTTLPGVSISSEDETKRFVQNMRFAVDELMQFANALSGHVRSTSIFDGHIEAIKISLRAMEKSTSPAKIARSSAKKMNFLDVEDLSKLSNSSGSTLQIIEMVHSMLAKERTCVNLSKFFQSGSVTPSDCGSKRRRETPPGRGIFFLECLSNIRIKCLEKQREEMKARNKLAEEEIRNQKLERELMRQKFKTVQQAKKLAAPGFGVDIRATIGSVQAHVDTHADLGSQQPFKRSRPEHSRGAQPSKRPTFDLRDDLNSTH